MLSLANDSDAAYQTAMHTSSTTGRCWNSDDISRVLLEHNQFLEEPNCGCGFSLVWVSLFYMKLMKTGQISDEDAITRLVERDKYERLR